MESNVKTIYVFQSVRDHMWYWRAKAGNGEIVAQGEGHTSERDARRAASGVFPGMEIESERKSD